MNKDSKKAPRTELSEGEKAAVAYNVYSTPYRKDGPFVLIGTFESIFFDPDRHASNPEPCSGAESASFDADIARGCAWKEYQLAHTLVLERRLSVSSELFGFALERRVQTVVDYIITILEGAMRAELASISRRGGSAASDSVVTQLVVTSNLHHLSGHSDHVVRYIATHGMFTWGPDGVNYLGVPESAPEIQGDLR